jgi:transcriptional regulator with XRE-family HTH domain
MKIMVEVSFDEYVGQRISKARKESGIRQETMAKQLGISAMGLSYIESGKRPLKVEMFFKILNLQRKRIEYYLPK